MRKMMSLVALIVAIVLVSGCTSTSVKNRLDYHDRMLSTIAQKIKQSDSNFQIIEKYYATKEMLKDPEKAGSDECPVCEPCECPEASQTACEPPQGG